MAKFFLDGKPVDDVVYVYADGLEVFELVREKLTMTVEEFLDERCHPPGLVPTDLPVALRNGCRDFSGSCSRGYGGVRHQGKLWRAHRLVYTLIHGSIPKKRPEIMHLCNRPSCCEPEHLQAATHQENMDYRRLCGRTAKGEIIGAKVRGDLNGLRRNPERCLARSHPERLARGDRHGSRTKPESLHRGEQHWTFRHPELVARGERQGAHTQPNSVARGERHWTFKHPGKIRRGEESSSCKLADLRVIGIMARSLQGVSQQQIAREYEVSPRTVFNILSGKTRQHLFMEAE